MTNQGLSIPLTSRGILIIAGEDRRNFLQGLISNDINLCHNGLAIYAALLTSQGKFLHDMFVIEDADRYMIDCDGGRADDLLKRLAMYKLRAKVTLENISAEKSVWASLDKVTHVEGISYADPRGATFGQRMIVKKSAAPGTPNGSFETYDAHRIRLGAPDGIRDLEIGKSTLLEANFDLLNGISWTKGCYIGQELTARMHYRALIKKRLTAVQFDGGQPAPGTILRFQDVEAGEMRSSSGQIGLALLSLDLIKKARDTQSRFTYDTGTLSPL